MLVEAEADLGGLVFGGWLYGNQDRATRVKSGTQRIESLTEVVLAIDTGSSMGKTLDGRSTTGNDSRLAIVKEAAADLVDILAPDGSTSVAIGIVPWDYLVRFDDTTKDRFLNNDWAVYPTKRYYPNPHDDSYLDAGLSSTAGWYPDPDTDSSAGEWHTVPKIWEKLGETKSFYLSYDWLGCVDERKRFRRRPARLFHRPPRRCAVYHVVLFVHHPPPQHPVHILRVQDGRAADLTIMTPLPTIPPAPANSRGIISTPAPRDRTTSCR